MTVDHALDSVAMQSSIQNKPVDTQPHVHQADVTPVGDFGTRDNTDKQGQLVYEGDACLNTSLLTDAVDRHLDMTRNECTVDLDDAYFKEPVLINSGTLAAGTTGGLAATVQLNYSAISGIPRWNERFNGFARMRCTWHLKVLVSPSPFVSGVLRLWHQPPLSGDLATVARFNNYPAFAQCPGVDLDLGEINAVCLDVPHISVLPWLRIPQQTGIDNGVVNLSYVTPLQLGTGSGVLPSYQIWLMISDVETDGRKPLDSELTNIIPAMGRKVKFAVKKGVKKTKPVEAEEEDKPVSTFLSASSRLADWAGTTFPMVSPITTPLSWVARMGSKVASAFGYSKPDTNLAIDKVVTNRIGYGPNATGNNFAPNCGVLHDAAVNPGYTNMSVVDEMSLDFVSAIKFPIMVTSFGASNVTGDFLAKGTISPWSQLYNGSNRVSEHARKTIAASATPDKPFWPGPALLAASQFSLWRGDTVFNIKLAKTRFHAGRLEFTYYYLNLPGTFNAVLPTTFAAGAVSTYRVEMDLGAGSDFEIVVPFAFDMEYCPYQRVIGVWGIRVVSPLVAPATVAANVPIIVQTSYRDVAYADPTANTLAPMAATGAPAVYPAMAGMADLDAATVGESVKSVKQLLLREHNTFATDEDQFWRQYQPATFALQGYAANPLNVWRWCYAYEKGGLVHRVEDRPQDGIFVNPYVPHGKAFAFETRAAPYITGGAPLNRDMAWRFQRYCPLVGWPTAAAGQTPLNTNFGLTNPRSTIYRYTTPGGNIEAIDLDRYESVADDFRFMHWYSTVPVQFVGGLG